MEKTIKKPVEEKPTVGKADRRINAILGRGAWSAVRCMDHTPSS